MNISTLLSGQSSRIWCSSVHFQITQLLHLQHSCHWEIFFSDIAIWVWLTLPSRVSSQTFATSLKILDKICFLIFSNVWENSLLFYQSVGLKGKSNGPIVSRALVITRMTLTCYYLSFKVQCFSMSIANNVYN